MKLPKDLKGDGRRVVAPAFATPVPSEAKCLKVTLSQAREIVRKLIDSGQTTHSPGRNTMWVPMEWCEKNGYEYKVHEVSSVDGEVEGYVVELLDKDVADVL